MTAPAPSSRHPFWLALGAGASIVGSGALLLMGRASEGVSGSGSAAGLGLYALVILLALAGLVLAAMAAKEYSVQKRQSHLG